MEPVTNTYIVFKGIPGVIILALWGLASYTVLIARRTDPGNIAALVRHQGWLNCVCGILLLLYGGLHLNFLRYGLAGLWHGALHIILGSCFGAVGYDLLTKSGEQVQPGKAMSFLTYLAWPTFLFLVLIPDR
jgi:hypothetical protein